MDCFPIAIFTYNRLRHTQETIAALSRNHLAQQSHLIIFSDGPKDNQSSDGVFKIRSYLRQVIGFKQIDIVEREKNWGFSHSIISGINETLKTYSGVIVVEDDIVTAPYFLTFLNSALLRYKDDHRIFSVTGFSPPPVVMTFPANYKEFVYLNSRFSSWGWATWKDRWQLANWNIADYEHLKTDPAFKLSYSLPGRDRYKLFCDQLAGRINSWDILWDAAHHVNHAYCVYPRRSLVNNIGLDGSGMNCGNFRINFLENNLSPQKHSFPDYLKPDTRVIQRYSRAFDNRTVIKIWRVYRIFLYFLKAKLARV
jgi:hypothetical protein